MTVFYHSPLAVPAAVNVAVVNAPLAQLDAAIVAQNTSIGVLQDALILGGAAATLTNDADGVASGQKVVVVDSTAMFVAGCHVEYTLVGGTAERNVVGTVDGLTQITLTTNIGTGGIANNSPISVVPLGLANATLSVHNVLDYGAVGDDTAPDYAALQAAITAAEVAGGGKVYLPPGTYKILTPLRISASNIEMYGQGGNSVIHYAGTNLAGDGMLSINSSTPATPVSRIYLHDLVLEGVYAESGSKGICVMGTGAGMVDSVFERLEIRDFESTGIFSAHDTTFSRNIVRDCKITHGRDFGIAGYDQCDCLFTGNYIGDLNQITYAPVGIYIKRDAFRNRITDNVIMGVRGTGAQGIVVYGDTTSHAESNVVANNAISQVAYYGISLTRTKHTVVANNVVEAGDVADTTKNGQTGICSYGENESLTWIGNSVKNMVMYGFFALNSGASVATRLTVVGNLSYNNHAGDAYFSVTGLSVMGCQIDPVTHDANNALLCSNCTGVVLTGNMIHCGGVGIRGTTTARLTINGNMFFDNSATDGIGISVESDCTKVTITNNNLETLTGNAISPRTTDYYLAGNRTPTTVYNILTVGAGFAGTPAAGKATALEYGAGIFHQTVLTFTLSAANDLELADGADHGMGVAVYTFPAGNILILGATIDGQTVVNRVFNASPNDVYYLAVGSATAADDGDLTSTEADIIPKTTFDTASSATWIFDWHNTLVAPIQFNRAGGTALSLYVNAAVADASTSAPVTVEITRTLTVTWLLLGNF